MAKYEDGDEGAFHERPRPLRRRGREEHYDDEYLPRVPRRQSSVIRQLSQVILVLLTCFPLFWGMVAMILGKSLILLVLLSVGCGMIALISGIVWVAAWRHRKGRRNGIIIMVISIVWISIGAFFFLVDNAGMMHHHRGQGLFQ